MSETCNGCGACCDPVALPVTQIEVLTAREYIEPRTKEWILKDLTPMSRKEAKAKAPWLFNTLVELQVKSAWPMFYRCKWFDAEQRICTNYENRPKPCRDYPWGDKPPRPNAMLPSTCSFRADIGKPVEPMPPEWQKVILSRKP